MAAKDLDQWIDQFVYAAKTCRKSVDQLEDQSLKGLEALSHLKPHIKKLVKLAKAGKLTPDQARQYRLLKRGEEDMHHAERILLGSDTDGDLLKTALAAREFRRHGNAL